MQAIIMAAGYGSRIAQLTDGKPKSFLKINDETLIERAIRLLRERGISDITVVTGYMEKAFQELLDEGVRYAHNPLYFCTNVLGSFACGMHNLKDDFIFLHADTVFDQSILDDLIDRDGDEIVLPIDFKRCGEEEMKVVTDGEHVRLISKEIDLEEAEGEFIGLAKLSGSILPRLKDAVIQELKQHANHHEYFEAALQNLIDQGTPVACLPTEGRDWIEIDFPEDYEAAMGMSL